MNRADRAAELSGALELRRFEAGDERAVLELHDVVGAKAGDHRGPGPRDNDLDAIPATYLDDGGEFLVGLRDGRLVAIGAVRHITDTVGELTRMCVHPAFQRRGFARLLLAQLEERAGSLGYRRLRLATSVAQAPAQCLYQSAGYREVGRGQLAGTDVIYFEKTLR